jgi:PAS domain-containing protein
MALTRGRATTGPETRPAGMTVGPGHVVVYGNPAFRAIFGEAAVGLPARESMLDLPADAFALLDTVLETGRPLARWIRRDGREWRLTAIPRREPGSDDVFGVAFHLRERDDLPVLKGS